MKFLTNYSSEIAVKIAL